MKLLFLDIKNARPEDKPYRISDGDGLSVQVQPSGHKLCAIATALPALRNYSRSARSP